MATTLGSAPSQQASPATGAVSSTYGGQKAPNPIAKAVVIGGARWFYWIVGLSIVNSLLAMGGAPIRFVFGLGITQFVPGYLASVPVLALFALCGYFASKLQKWPFIVGGLVYVVDAGICLLVQDYISVAVHAYVLFRIYQGFSKVNDARPVQPGVLTA
ncbi:MAG TPA: hypothetical protein VF493_07180 [Terriglobales bacterium]